MNKLLNNDPKVIAEGIKEAIKANASSEKRSRADEGIAYYNYRNDILDNRIVYFNGQGELVEDKYASNLRISHGFLPELVDQKVQLLLSNPVEVVTEDAELAEKLKEYYNEDFHMLLQDVVENASQKGFEYVYARTTADDHLAFQIADGLSVVPVLDEDGVTKRILRYYNREATDKDGKKTTLSYAELYSETKVWYFTAEKDDYELETGRGLNPAPHVIAVNDDKETVGRDYGRLPFYRYQNNQREMTDLEPIKAIIDDYDLMNASLSNNLQDFQEAIYVVRGYEGGSLDELKTNLRTKKAVGVGENGGVDVKTIDIPIEARRTKLDMDRENIYKFGFGFDSAQVGDGNITNVVIKGRYTLLNMKANKTETRLRAFLRWVNEMVINDINRLSSADYKPSDVTFEITREMLVNENDLVANEKMEAEKRNVEIDTLLAVAPRLSDEDVLKKICEVYDMDYDEVSQRLELEQYTGLGGAADGEG